MPARSLAARSRAAARQHPPTVATGIAGSVGAVLFSLLTIAIDALPASAPDHLTTSLLGLAVAVVGVATAFVGKFAQRFTYPAEFVEAELLDAEHVLGSARAAGDLDEG